MRAELPEGFVNHFISTCLEQLEHPHAHVRLAAAKLLPFLLAIAPAGIVDGMSCPFSKLFEGADRKRTSLLAPSAPYARYTARRSLLDCSPTSSASI
jgi:hypothetical protein